MTISSPGRPVWARSWGRERRALAVILIVALALRIGYALLLGPSAYSWDGRVYDQIAHNLLNGTGFNYGPGFNESFRPPLYPFFLAGIYKVFGSSIMTVRIVQAIIGTVTCLVVYITGKRRGGARLGLLAAGIVALHPWSIWYTREVMSEVLFTLLFALAIYFLLLVRTENGTLLPAAAGGLFFALAALAKPFVLLLAIAGALWLVLRRVHDVRRNTIAAGLMLTILILTLAPWVVRNYRVHHSFVLISTNGGSNFYIGNHPGISDQALHTGTDMNRVFEPTLSAEQETTLASLSEVGRDHQYYEWAFQFIREEPGRFFYLLKEKLIIFWSVTREVPVDRFENLTGGRHTAEVALWIIVTGFELALFVLAAVGLVFGVWKRILWTLPMLGLIIGFTAIYVAFFPELRFRLPLTPYLALLASSGLLSTWATVRSFLPPARPRSLNHAGEPGEAR